MSGPMYRGEPGTPGPTGIRDITLDLEEIESAVMDYVIKTYDPKNLGLHDVPTTIVWNFSIEDGQPGACRLTFKEDTAG